MWFVSILYNIEFQKQFDRLSRKTVLNTVNTALLWLTVSSAPCYVWGYQQKQRWSELIQKMCGNQFFSLSLSEKFKIWITDLVLTPLVPTTDSLGCINMANVGWNMGEFLSSVWKQKIQQLFFFLFQTLSSSPVHVRGNLQGSSLDDGSSWRVAALLWGSGGCLSSSSSLKLNQPAGESSYQPAYLMLEMPTTNEWTLAND